MRTMRHYLTFALLGLSFLLVFSFRANAQCVFTNGDFETGNLTGWTIYTRILSQPANWYNYTGTLTPQTAHNISAPPQGTRAAVTDHNNATTHELYQNVAIPAGQSTLSFFIAYNNTNNTFVTLNTLDYTGNQQVRIDLMTTTAANESIAPADVLEKLFQTQPGDPFVMNPSAMFYDVSAFAGQTVRLRFAEAVGLNYFPFAQDVVCLSTTRTTFTQSTATGSNVKNNFGEVRVIYPSVTVAGNTSVQQLDPAAQSGPPAGDTFTGPTWDISTTAVATTPINVCVYLPQITNANTFAHLRMLHQVAGVWVDLPSSQVSFAAKTLCGSVTSLSPFSAAISSGAPTAATSAVTGHITDNDGNPVDGAVVKLSGSQNRKTITDASGNYHFDQVETNGFYTVTPSRANYNFTPATRSVSALGAHTDASFNATASSSHQNPLDTTEYFVRQQYLDFLGREPEEQGFNAWTDTINNCAPGDASCDRVHVSEMFFRSEEFQQRGYFVYRFYSTALYQKPDYAAFAHDFARVSGFLTDDQLEAAKTAFANDFVNRPAFAQYNSMTNAQYVDALSASAGVSLSNRPALIDSLNTRTATRAQVLRQIAESSEVYAQYYNQAFVVMEYFGYLKRDPDALYSNWIQVLDANPADSRHMVEGFVNAAEYRNRFNQ